MSHFSVAVFHKKDQSINDLLAPYEETIPFDSENTKLRHVYCQCVRAAYPKYRKATDEECFAFLLNKQKRKGKGPIWLINPDWKWDSYAIGGRWENMLRVNGKKVNSARVKDVDFSIDEHIYQLALDEWNVLIDGKPNKPGKEYDDFPDHVDYMLSFGDKESYAKRAASFGTFAVITPDGAWHEKGRMGWFGVSSETLEEALEWDRCYQGRYIDTADPEWIITIVDCHI